MADQSKFVRVTVLDHGVMLNHDVLLAPGHLIEMEENVAAELINCGKVAAAQTDDQVPVRLIAAGQK